MARPLLYSVLLGAAVATAARAQNPYQAAPAGGKPADIAGTWDGKTMVGPKDSVITTWTLVIGAGGKSFTLTFPNRAPVAGPVPPTGGDSHRCGARPLPRCPPPRPLPPPPTVSQCTHRAHPPSPPT